MCFYVCMYVCVVSCDVTQHSLFLIGSEMVLLLLSISVNQQK